MLLYSEANRRAEEYAKRRSLSIEGQLGGGVQGVVFSTDAGTALKAMIRNDCYVRERDVYLRLTDHEVNQISGFWVPKLLAYHDELLVIEMQIVTPPYVLDFASAYLDAPPPYANDAAIMAAWESEKREQFESRWPEVRTMMSAFRAYGIHLADVKPGNVTFAE